MARRAREEPAGAAAASSSAAASASASNVTPQTFDLPSGVAAGHPLLKQYGNGAVDKPQGGTNLSNCMDYMAGLYRLNPVDHPQLERRLVSTFEA
jgi:hypothetical protein